MFKKFGQKAQEKINRQVSENSTLKANKSSASTRSPVSSNTAKILGTLRKNSSVDLKAESKRMLNAFKPIVLSSELIDVRKTWHTGWTGKSTVMAYDAVQSLIAVATENGFIHIFGQPGFEMKTKVPQNQYIKYMHFIINKGLLIAITERNIMYLVDLRGGIPIIIHDHSLNATVTSTEMGASDAKDMISWLYAGTDKGNILPIAVRSDGFKVSKDNIYWNSLIAIGNKKHPGCVMAIKESPKDPAKLLIGHSSGNVCVYDIVKKSCAMIAKYEVRPLSTMEWHPIENRFLVGFMDGSKLMWSNMKPEPETPSEGNHTLSPSVTGMDQPMQALKGIVWTNSDTCAILVYQGGHPVTKGYNSITLVRGDNKRSSMSFEEPVTGVCLCKDSPWAQDATSVHSLLLCFSHQLVALDLTTSSVQVLQAPYCTQLAKSVITTYQVCWDIDQKLMTTLRWLGKKQGLDSIAKSWPIKGGLRMSKRKDASLDIAVVGHDNGLVKFYDISSSLSISLLCVASVVALCGRACLSPSQDTSIKSILFQAKSRHLTVVCGSGEVFLFTFALVAKTVDVAVTTGVLDEPSEVTACRVLSKCTRTTTSGAGFGEGAELNRLEGAPKSPSLSMKSGASLDVEGIIGAEREGPPRRNSQSSGWKKFGSTLLKKNSTSAVLDTDGIEKTGKESEKYREKSDIADKLSETSCKSSPKPSPDVLKTTFKKVGDLMLSAHRKSASNSPNTTPKTKRNTTANMSSVTFLELDSQAATLDVSDIPGVSGADAFKNKFKKCGPKSVNPTVDEGVCGSSDTDEKRDRAVDLSSSDSKSDNESEALSVSEIPTSIEEKEDDSSPGKHAPQSNDEEELPSAIDQFHTRHVDATMPPGFQLSMYFRGVFSSASVADPIKEGVIVDHNSDYHTLAVVTQCGTVCVVDTQAGELLMCENIVSSAELLDSCDNQVVQSLATDKITSASFNAMYSTEEKARDSPSRVQSRTPNPTLMLTTAKGAVAFAMVVPHTIATLTSVNYLKSSSSGTNVMAKGMAAIGLVSSGEGDFPSKSITKEESSRMRTLSVSEGNSGDKIILMNLEGKHIRAPQMAWVDVDNELTDSEEDNLPESQSIWDISTDVAEGSAFVIAAVVCGSVVSTVGLPAGIVISTHSNPNTASFTECELINWSASVTNRSDWDADSSKNMNISIEHTALSILDERGVWTILSLPDLKPIVMSESTPCTGPKGTTALGSDGRLVCITPSGCIERWSAIRSENRLGLPQSVGSAFTPGISLPERKPGGGLMASMFGSDTATVNRAALFAMSDESDAMHRIAEARNHRAKEKQKLTETTQQKSETIAGTMRENKQMLLERGEKLENIGDRTETMQDDAKNFLDNIREYNRKQAAKKWYQI
eukprot:CFRG3170T1